MNKNRVTWSNLNLPHPRMATCYIRIFYKEQEQKWGNMEQFILSPSQDGGARMATSNIRILYKNKGVISEYSVKT